MHPARHSLAVGTAALWKRPLLLTGAAMAFALPAYAAEPPSRDGLAETIRRQDKLIRALQARVEALEARPAAAAPAADSLATTPAAPRPPQPVLAAVAVSRTGVATTVGVRGRLHADAWAVADGASGSELRRARLGVEGKIDGVFPYLIEADLAGNVVSLQDAYLDHPLGGHAALRLGYHKAPFSLDEQTSDNDNLFMEHPVGVTPFVPGRGLGAAVLARGTHWFVHAGVFGEGENDARDGAFDENLTYAARFVWAPILESDRYVHLAAAGYHIRFGDTPGYTLRERPGRHLAEYQVTTGALDADHATALGFEAAGSAGPFGAAAEYARSRVGDRSRGNLEFGGYAVEAWWNLTGEFRPYSLNGGVFGRLTPARPVASGGPGAWQVAVRYSRLDLEDAALSAGALETGSIALNWGLTRHARLMFDLNRSHAERPAGEIDQTGLGARVQIDW